MALTVNKPPRGVTGKTEPRRGPADAATYKAGQIVAMDTSGRVKIPTGSLEPNFTLVGKVVKEQVISTAGDDLYYEAGQFKSVLDDTYARPNVQLFFLDDETFSTGSGASDNRVQGAKYVMPLFDTSSYNCIVDIGNTVSGTYVSGAF